MIKNILDLDITVQWQGQARISPEAANKILDMYNLRNRRRRGQLLDYLKRQILTDEWQADHPQPIVFSAKRLMDGQHRMWAIAESNRTVIANVVTGARDELHEYIDTGISRTLEDRIRFCEDLRDNRRIAMIVNIMSWVTVSGGKVVKLTPVEAVNVFQAHKDAIMFAADYAKKSIRGVTTAGVMAALVEMRERDAEKARVFADGLCSVNGEVQQARRLREYLLSGRVSAGGSAGVRETYAKTVGAMRAYIEGRRVNALRSSSWEGTL